MEYKQDLLFVEKEKKKSCAPLSRSMQAMEFSRYNMENKGGIGY